MGKNVILTGEGVAQFNYALDLLNSSILGFQKIADKMIPQKLVNEGLVVYLEEFCKFISAEHNIKTSYIFEGNPDRLFESIEMAMFRGFRSLIVLILKHSQPTLIDVKLVRTNENLKLNIKDNGLPGALKMNEENQSTLDNLHENLNTVKGTMQFGESELGNETEFVIPLMNS